MDRAHAQIDTQNRKSHHRWTHPHLLKGKLRTHEDSAMSPGSMHRPLSRAGNSGQKRLVRYYISQKAIKHGFKHCPIKTINAAHLDELVRALVLDHVRERTPGLDAQPAETRDHWVREIIASVTLAPDRVTVRLNPEMIDEYSDEQWPATTKPAPPYPTCIYKPEVDDRGRYTVLTLHIQIKRLDGHRVILSPEGRDLVIPAEPEPKPHIVNAIGLAYR